MWKITITLDEGRTDVGTITGIWTEGDDTFAFSARSLTDEKSQTGFFSLATVARDKWQEKQVGAKVIANKMTTQFNTTDAKASVKVGA